MHHIAHLTVIRSLSHDICSNVLTNALNVFIIPFFQYNIKQCIRLNDDIENNQLGYKPGNVNDFGFVILILS